jgi:c-di-GMP-binding flagellar brake protein YcgR
LLAIKVPGKFAASTLLTAIIHIEKNYIFLDGFQNERFNKDLLNQNTLTASANLEGIAVSFILSEISGHYINGTLTLMAPLPQSMEWIQRRNARRVKVPTNIPVKIQYKEQTDYFNVADISVTGLSYIDQTEDHQFSAIGGLYTDCNIVLPDKSTHFACFEIVNNITIPYKHTKQINRVGCEIKRASYRLDTALQHLINKIDCHYQ